MSYKQFIFIVGAGASDSYAGILDTNEDILYCNANITFERFAYGAGIAKFTNLDLNSSVGNDYEAYLIVAGGYSANTAILKSNDLENVFVPTLAPTSMPTLVPTVIPTKQPTKMPTEPSYSPTNTPTNNPSVAPTNNPTHTPTDRPTQIPSFGDNDYEFETILCTFLWSCVRFLRVINY